MGIVFLVWLIFLVGVFMVVTHKIVIGSFLFSGAVIAVLFFVLVFWSVRRLTRPLKAMQGMQAPPARPAADPDSGSITFRVAGTTFENDDGESRQDILRHMKFGDAPWADDPEDLDGQMEETIINGEPAIAVTVNGYQVGFVPKSLIPRVSKALQNVATCYVSNVRIIGGGTGTNGKQLNYGCEISLEY